MSLGVQFVGADLPPKTQPRVIKVRTREQTNEAILVFGRADCLDLALVGVGRFGAGFMPQARCEMGDCLQVEGQAWRTGRYRWVSFQSQSD